MEYVMENQNENKDVKKTDDEVWDEQMADLDNAIFFEELDKQVEEALAKGDYFEGDLSAED
jgi:hypothetical protein